MCKVGERLCESSEKNLPISMGPSRLKIENIANGAIQQQQQQISTISIVDTDSDNVDSDEASLSTTPLSTKLSTSSPFDVIYSMKFNRIEGRTIYLSRHGESEYNVTSRIGGNPPLTPKGQRYAKALGAYMNNLGIPNLKVITSSLRRTHMTAAFIEADKASTSMLDELNSGFMDGFTYADFKMLYPEEYAQRKKDKLRYRYPGGESYLDCCERVLNTLICVETRQDENFLLVAHQGLLRCVIGYLLCVNLEEIPYISVPQHAIIRATWSKGRYHIDYIKFPVEEAS